MNRTPSAGAQRGGTILGLIFGLLIGLGIALAVALYIAKVPAPFVDKVPHRTPEQDAAEAERNKNWDPNAPLAGKQANRPAAEPAASAPTTPAAPTAPVAQPASTPAPAATKPAAAQAEAPKSSRDPAAILAGQAPNAAPPAAKASAPAPAGGKDGFIYFVQAGAYSSGDDAEQQRARLAMQGLMAKVTEREQGGRTVHRVRLGPFETREEAEASQDKLKAAGAEAVLVRMERSASR